MSQDTQTEASTRDLDGLVAFVTGGTSGIGRETAIEFARRGAKAVVITGRREAEGRETVGLINEAGGEGLFIRSDVSVEAEIKGAIDQVIEKYGRLDVAFNNAGIEGAVGTPVVEASFEDYRKVFDINVAGVLLSMKHEIPALAKSGGGKTEPGGSIINNASIAGSIGLPGMGVYIGSKHAVIGITKTAALEVARQNVRVNSVSPAGIQTEMFDRFTGGDESDAAQQFAEQHPVGRVGEVREIANAVAFLASPRTTFLTGHDLKVDGGWTAR
ncbi:MAG: glucose 1-dehydrogenase [Planctomycetota bacterium]